jgi:hypothetical protein
MGLGSVAAGVREGVGLRRIKAGLLSSNFFSSSFSHRVQEKERRGEERFTRISEHVSNISKTKLFLNSLQRFVNIIVLVLI